MKDLLSLLETSNLLEEDLATLKNIIEKFVIDKKAEYIKQRIDQQLIKLILGTILSNKF